jgi:hypothetical protein
MSNKRSVHYQPATEKKRVEAYVTREIQSPPRAVFPMACPVEELRWIPDWDYQLLYSKSGVNETNCIFTEDKSGPHFFGKPLTTTWVTNLHDPENYRIVFQLNFGEKAVIRFCFEIQEVGIKVSRCKWHMVFTALDEEADRMEDEIIRTKLEMVMTFLAEALKAYCETGEMST